MPQFDIICLANSRKLCGRCVAGLRIDGLGWLRPVSNQDDGTLFGKDYILNNSTEAAPLDVIRVGVKAYRPAPHQPENWLVDGTAWTLLARPMKEELSYILQNAIVYGPDLLRGNSDRVAYTDFQQQNTAASLALIAPDRLDLIATTSVKGKPQVRGRFSLGRGSQACSYNLVVTDPRWEAMMKEQDFRTITQRETKFLLTISLGEPFNEYCFKLIAAIILIPPALAVHF